MSEDIHIPKKALFKPAEVCSLAGVQTYVLSSWEAEFSELGRLQKKDGSRIYRRVDVELVLRIKQLVFVDGLTLGAARRQLQGEQEDDFSRCEESLDDLLGKNARDRVVNVRNGLQGILKLLLNGNVEPVQIRPEIRKKTKRTDAVKKVVARKHTGSVKSRTK
jgi:DNA-binding transcriptional MerR regulator